MLTSLEQFISACTSATNDQIYDLFETECSDELRDLVYEFSDPESPEPFRSAMFNLGFTRF